MKTLGELCAAGGVPCPKGMEKAVVAGITDNAGRVRAGYIFVALRGHRTDGKSYISEAEENGAVAVLCEDKPEIEANMQIIICKNARFASTKMLLCFFGNPERRMKLIGVTGTKGKTTTAFAAAHILTENGIPAASVGTVGVCFGGEIRPTPNTTPSAFYLVPELSRLAARGCRAAVLEMSSLGLKDERLSGLPLSHAVLTSVGTDHIGNGAHPDFDDYLCAKRKLFTDYGVTAAVFPEAEPYAGYLTRGVENRLSVSTSRDNPDAFVPRSVTPRGTWFAFRNHAYFLSLPGAFSLTDCALAATVCVCAFPLDPVRCVAPLATLRVPGRLQTCVRGGVRYVVDFAHNPMSFSAVADLYRPRDGRLIAVFGSVGGREYERRRELCLAAQSLFDLSVLTEDDAGEEPLFGILADMIGVFSDKTRVKVIPDRAEAVRYAVSVAGRGDTVLLLGKGAENCQRRREGRFPYSDAEALKRALSE